MNDKPIVGQPLQRVDGFLKVTGSARYAAEFKPANLAYGALIRATIAKGRVRGMDLAAAQNAPGVIGILSSQNVTRFRPYPEQIRTKGWPGENRVPLQDDQVHWQGQPIGVVVADSYEHARYAASLVRVEYSREEPLLTIDDERAQSQAIKPELFAGREKLQVKRGDPEGELARMPPELRIEAVYKTPIENHNPIEMLSTTAVWEAPDRLLLYDATRWIKGIQRLAANAFSLPQENVRVIAPFIGGAFGSKGFTWGHILLSAAAARLVGRPVRLTLTRPEMFDFAGQRAQTIQELTLGAEQNGKLVAIQHATTTHCSPISEYTEPCGNMTRLLYSCPNVEVSHRLVRLNYTSPCPMRAPGEAPGVFALESAIDELAVNLGIDPLDMRLRNYADSDEYERRPWSSKHLRECYLRAAERFGWSQRKADPKSMRNKDGQLIGWGMATAVYPAIQMPASVRVILDRKGEAVLQSATHEIGTGTYTAMTQLAAEALGLSLEQVHFELGDSEYPEAPANGGSWLTASVGAAVIAACNRLKQQLISLASESSSAPFFGKQVIVDQGKIRLKDQPSQSLSYSELLDLNNLPQIAAEQGAKPGEERERFSFQSFGSIFVEVKVDSEIGQVHVSRAVGVYDVGHIINPRLARSQLLGGITFGIGMALLEQSIPDPRIGRIVNANLAEYHVPVCTDIPTQFDVDFLGVPDPYMNAPGARGIGEIGIVGTPAAIANAIYHATGKRIRELPITLDKLT